MEVATRRASGLTARGLPGLPNPDGSRLVIYLNKTDFQREQAAEAKGKGKKGKGKKGKGAKGGKGGKGKEAKGGKGKAKARARRAKRPFDSHLA